MKFKKNQTVELVIDQLNENFEGISYLDGVKIVTPEVLVGEKVVVKIVKPGKNVSFATPLSFIVKSEFREDVDDNLLELSHLNYDHLMKIKQNQLSTHYNLDIETIPSVLSNFRNKLFFPAEVVDKKFIFGLYKKRSHKIEPYNFDSPIFSDEVNSALKSISMLINRETLAFKSNIVGIYLRGEKGSYQLGFQLLDDDTYNRRLSIIKFDEMISSIFVYKKGEGNSVLVEDPIFLRGEQFVNLSIKDYNYRLRPESFFQLNSYITEKVIDDVSTFFKDIALSNINDFYAGCGVLSNYFTNYNKRTLFEKSRHSYQYLENTPKLTLVTEDLYSAEIDIDGNSIFIFDPPRKGIGKKCVDLTLKHKPSYVIYLSCNYRSQKSDIEPLLDIYDIEFIKGYDMFPYTKHLEVLAILKLK